MKLLLCMALFFAASSAKPSSPEVEFIGNHMEDLVKQTAEYVRFLFKRHDPYNLPDMPDQTLVDEDVNVVISASGVGVSNAADFTLDEVKVNPIKLHANFKATVPSGHASGNYKVSGTAFGKEVKGSGSFAGDLTKLVVTGTVQLDVVDHSLQVTDLDVAYTLDDLKLNLDGLTVEGFTDEEVQEFMSKKVLAYLKEQNEYVAQRTAAHVKEIANKVLKGHTLGDIISFLEKLVASTPDPLPFTIFP